MTNEFLVQAREVLLLDETDFLTHGGEQLHFGSICNDTVPIYAIGSPEAIGRLARTIITHHTAAH